MTILWLYQSKLNPEAGGTERVTSLVMQGLSSRGYKNLAMLVCNQHTRIMSFNDEPVRDLYQFLKDNHIDVVINQIAYSPWLLEEFLQQGGERWKQEGGRIISQLHFDPKLPSALYNAKLVADGSLRSYLNIFKTWLFAKRYQRINDTSASSTFEYIYTHSDWFVVLSETHFTYMKQVWIRSGYERLVAINNPLTFPDISDESICKRKQKTVLVVARMSEYHKRISMCLIAWKQLCKQGIAVGWKLQIVGDGLNLNAYKQYVIDNHMENVIFEGQQSPESFYNDASIFLMTSLAEGWGLTLTESLQRGVVPVVMNSSPVFSEIIEDGVTGYLVSNNNHKVFAKAIATLMTDESKLQSMSRNCLLQAQKFTVNVTIDKWEKIIN